MWASRVDPPEKFTVWASEALFTQQTMTVAAIHPPIHPSASVRCCRRRWERTSPASSPPPTQCRPPFPPPFPPPTAIPKARSRLSHPPFRPAANQIAALF